MYVVSKYVDAEQTDREAGRALRYPAKIAPSYKSERGDRVKYQSIADSFTINTIYWWRGFSTAQRSNLRKV